MLPILSRFLCHFFSQVRSLTHTLTQWFRALTQFSVIFTKLRAIIQLSQECQISSALKAYRLILCDSRRGLCMRTLYVWKNTVQLGVLSTVTHTYLSLCITMTMWWSKEKMAFYWTNNGIWRHWHGLCALNLRAQNGRETNKRMSVETNERTNERTTKTNFRRVHRSHFIRCICVSACLFTTKTVITMTSLCTFTFTFTFNSLSFLGTQLWFKWCY